MGSHYCLTLYSVVAAVFFVAILGVAAIEYFVAARYSEHCVT